MTIPLQSYLSSGIQFKCEYYCPACSAHPANVSDEEIQPWNEGTAWHNSSRVPEIADTFWTTWRIATFGAITASINAKITFESVGSEAEPSEHWMVEWTLGLWLMMVNTGRFWTGAERIRAGLIWQSQLCSSRMLVWNAFRCLLT